METSKLRLSFPVRSRLVRNALAVEIHPLEEVETTLQVDESGPDAERRFPNEDRCAHESSHQGRHRSLQNGDRKTWSALFEPDVELYDDGSPRSLKEFTRDAFGHERFTSIDRVENNGLDLTGAFHSDRWGDFQTYFRFQLSPAGKINRLDIGQAT